MTLARLLRDLDPAKCKPRPSDEKLYEKAREEVKGRVKRWPSAYASAQLVQEYKKRGGTYEPGCERGGLDVWFAEEWVDICRDGLPPCGRDTAGMSEAEYRRAYPKCRPRTVAEAMGDEERDAACRRKRRAVRKAGTKVVRVK
jgi:hypothetical protein